MTDRSADPSPRPAHDVLAEDAGAYVLGALDADERAAFEAHLAGCAACRAATAEVAGLPALLATVPREGLADPPPSVLVRLLATVARSEGPVEAGPVGPASAAAVGPARRVPGPAARARRARRWWAVGGLAAAAAAGFVAGAVVVPSGAPAGQDATSVALEPVVAAVPVDASVDVEPVPWGTRLTVTCTYRGTGGYGGTGGGPADYALVVRGADGSAEQVATWVAVPGEEVTVPAASGLAADEITRVEMVRGGEVVLAASL